MLKTVSRNRPYKMSDKLHPCSRLGYLFFQLNKNLLEADNDLTFKAFFNCYIFLFLSCTKQGINFSSNTFILNVNAGSNPLKIVEPCSQEFVSLFVSLYRYILLFFTNFNFHRCP